MERKTHLLIIDPQNDFLDVAGAALPVNGANADMTRLADFIGQLGARLSDITVTLDSHHSVGIERPAMWIKGEGGDVAPFTQITAADVRGRRFLPRSADALPRVLAYLDALEAGGRYTLMVWPAHCEIGTWGHNIEDGLRAAYNRWEAVALRPVRKVFKGMNPWTENYSALQAEVPDPKDPATQLNVQLIASLDAADTILIAGEASSHCVKATTEHLADHMPSGKLSKLVLLSDCMSPVPGFEKQAAQFMERMAARGARVMTAEAYLKSSRG